jgi:hypothetical protein
MTPVTNSLSCSICFNDELSPTTTLVQWHKPVPITVRPHGACIDCATAICLNALSQNKDLLNPTLSCPECREILVIKGPSLSSIISSINDQAIKDENKRLLVGVDVQIKLGLSFLVKNIIAQSVLSTSNNRLSIPASLTVFIANAVLMLNPKLGLNLDTYSLIYHEILKNSFLASAILQMAIFLLPSLQAGQFWLHLPLITLCMNKEDLPFLSKESLAIWLLLMPLGFLSFLKMFPIQEQANPVGLEALVKQSGILMLGLPFLGMAALKYYYKLKNDEDLTIPDNIQKALKTQNLTFESTGTYAN